MSMRGPRATHSLPRSCSCSDRQRHCLQRYETCCSLAWRRLRRRLVKSSRSASVVGRRVPHWLLEAVTDRDGEQLDARTAPGGRRARSGDRPCRRRLLSVPPRAVCRRRSRAACFQVRPPECMARLLGHWLTHLDDSFARAGSRGHWRAAGEMSEGARRVRRSGPGGRAGVGVQGGAGSLRASRPCCSTRYRGGIDLLDEPRYRLLWRAAEMAHLSAHPSRAAELIRAAIDVVDPAEALHHGYLHERLGRYLWMSAEGKGALEAYETAMALTPADPPTSWRAAVLSGYSQVLMLASRFAEAEVLAREAIEIARNLPGSRSTEGHARNNLGVSLAHLGQFDKGVTELQHATAHCR